MFHISNLENTIPQNVKPFSSFSRIFPLFFHFRKYESAICGKSFNSFRKVSCLYESLFRPRKSPILRSENRLGSAPPHPTQRSRKASGWRLGSLAEGVRLANDQTDLFCETRCARPRPAALTSDGPFLRIAMCAPPPLAHEKGPRPDGRGPGIQFRRCAYSATFALRVASSS